MENEIVENDTQTEEETPVVPVVEETPAEETPAEEPAESPELKSALVQKEKFREKLEKKEAELEALKKKPAEVADENSAPLDVEDYIDISTSLDGLDQREKAYLAEQHKLSGKPLTEIRESEDFQLWDEAYRAKQEKENALKPNSAQEREDAPKPFTEQLKGATLAEKEALLKEKGLYKENLPPSSNRVDIGNPLSRNQ